MEAGMTRPIDECEVKAHENWVTISIGDALLLRRTLIRCKECGGRIRAHQNYMEGAAPHFVHFARHDGCSTSTRLFSGVRSRHPEALE